MAEQAFEENVYKTLSRKQKEMVASTRDVHYGINLLIEVIVPDKAAQRGSKNDIQSCHLYLRVKIHKGDIKAQENLRGEGLLVDMTQSGDIETFRKEHGTNPTLTGGKDIAARYGEREKHFKRWHGEHATSKGAEDKACYRDGGNTISRSQRIYLNIQGDCESLRTRGIAGPRL